MHVFSKVTLDGDFVVYEGIGNATYEAGLQF